MGQLLVEQSPWHYQAADWKRAVNSAARSTFIMGKNKLLGTRGGLSDIF